MRILVLLCNTYTFAEISFNTFIFLLTRVVFMYKEHKTIIKDSRMYIRCARERYKQANWRADHACIRYV